MDIESIKAMLKKILLTLLLISFFWLTVRHAHAQCVILEPGFRTITSSKGCAPYTVQLETTYRLPIPGTQYFVDWGDGTPIESYTQTNTTGVVVTHIYPLASVDCGYDVVIDASNSCNPLGSVPVVRTEVVVWAKDEVSIGPSVLRVCQGVAHNFSFTDNSQWNCFPRATRENKEPRWIQWIYGTGPLANQIPGIQVNGILPGAFPYLNPAPFTNPSYNVIAPGQASLTINVPATTVADIGKEFEVTLKNWNQCNPYDDNVLDGNGFNPVSGDLVNGDKPAQVATARVVIVPVPQPDFVTRLGNAAGPIKTIFCIDDNIYFDDETPSIAGASYRYTWEFYDNATGTGAPLSTSTSSNPTFSYPTSGQKYIRLRVRDQNAAGSCLNSTFKVIDISPSRIAQIGVTDLSNNPITPDFCQQAVAPFNTFQVRFADVSTGTVTPTTEWKWEFYNESNVLVRQVPNVGFSSTPLGPQDQSYVNKGIYRVRLRIRDNLTDCESSDEKIVRVYEKPIPLFIADRVCEGNPTPFTESSTLNAISGESIILREWDFNYNGTTFNKDPAFDNRTSFTRTMGAGTYQVALRVTTNQNGCSDLAIIQVKVDAKPIASFTPNVSTGCGPLTVSFTNNSVLGQPEVIDRFVWEVDERGGLGFQPVATQRPTDPGFSATFVRKFQNPTTVNKLYDVRLRVFTANCENAATTQVITVSPGTISGFNELNYSPFSANCSPVTVNFRADNETQVLNPTDYSWKVSDVNGLVFQTSTGTNPAFNYSFSNLTDSYKDFSVNLVTTLSSTCNGDSTRMIRVSPVPTSLFVIDTLQFDCEKVKMRLTAIRKGLSAYHWVITENATTVVNITSTQDQIERTFNRPAFASADLAVQFSLDTKNFANCPSPVNSVPFTVPKQENISTSFLVTPASQSLPNATVAITNTTNVGPWKYLWDFGDKKTSTDPTVTSHTYDTYGVYVITLTVSSEYCIENYTQTIEILAIPPVVNFSYDPASGCAPLRVKFKNLSQFADPLTYEWDFGDGNTSKEVDPMHVYARPDDYTVTLSASNVTRQRITETKQRIIEVFPIPAAAFDIKPKVLYIPGGIMYTNNLSLDANTFFWDFGDNTFSSDPEPEHRYTEEGDYTIKLKAFNQYGCQDSTKLENIVKVVKGGQVLVPNAFSPNVGSVSGGGGLSDGKNDIFLPVMRGVTQFELLIFDRWGELLFESQDASRGWDGSHNGKLCQQDVYMYKLTASFENGEKIVRVGDVNLIR
jgi:gliding motility-associated-like protein